MKLYSQDVIDAIQNSIDYNKEYTLSKFESLNDFPKKIHASDITVSLIENGEKHDVAAVFNDNIDSTSKKWWKQTGIGKFYGKDWKMYTGENAGALLDKYQELRLTIKNISMVILLRVLDEDEMDEETYNEYTDINIDDINYSIIKIYIDEIESYNVSSYFEDNIYDSMPVEVPAPKRGRKPQQNNILDEDDEDDSESDDMPVYYPSETLF